MIWYPIIVIIILTTLLFQKIRYGKIIFSIPIITVILELGKVFSVQFHFENGYNGFSFLILFLILIVSIADYKIKKKIIKFFVLFIILVAYFVLRSNWNGNNYLNLISRLGNTFLPLFSFIVGYAVFKNIQNIYLINKNLVFSAAIFIAFTIIFTILKFGDTAYKGGIIYGTTQFQFYFFSLFVVLSPLIISANRSKSNRHKVNGQLLVITVLFSLIIVAISLMRTTWMIVFLGGMGYLLYLDIDKRVFKNIVLGLLLLSIIGGYVFVSGVYKIRQSRFNENYDIEQEGRIIEYSLVLNDITKSLSTILFGTGNLYNAKGKYGFGERPMHSTYTNILFGSGIIGLLIFLCYLYYIFRNIKSIRSSKYRFTLIAICKAASMGIFFSLMVAFFSANTTYGYGISYFVTSFIFMGLMVGYFHKVNKNQFKIKVR